MTFTNDVLLELVNSDNTLVLENLMTLYLYELSEYADDLHLSNNGKFEYQGIELYHSDKDLKAFIAYYKEQIAGFVLLNSGKYVRKEINYSVHELFVIKSLRRRNIATSILKTLMSEYKGVYKNEQIATNERAVKFWKNFYEKEKMKYSECEEIIDGFKCYSQIVDTNICRN